MPVDGSGISLSMVFFFLIQGYWGNLKGLTFNFPN